RPCRHSVDRLSCAAPSRLALRPKDRNATPLDSRDKNEQRERHERFLRKHFRTREEQKAIEESAKARRATQRGKKGRRARPGLEDELEDAGFEKLSRAPRRRVGPTLPGPSLVPQAPREDVHAARGVSATV